QRWADPDAPAGRPRSWLRLVRNGRRAQDLSFTGRAAQDELEVFWSGTESAFTPSALTQEQMWGKLLELAGITPARCPGGDCSGMVLPVAWWICPECGHDVRRVASGAMLTPRGRGVIVVDCRRPSN